MVGESNLDKLRAVHSPHHDASDLEPYDDVLIHVGKHKAASSFLQLKLFPRLTPNLCTDLAIPKRLLADDFAPDSFRNFVNDHLDKQVEVEYPEGADRQLIISREALSTRTTPEVLDTMARRLKQSYPDARILILIREQFDLIVTLYAWATCKQHLRFTFQQYARWVMAERPQLLLHHHAVEAYVRHFGLEQVSVIPFEQIRNGSDRFFRDVSQLVVADADIEISKDRVNVTYKKESVIKAVIVVNTVLMPFLYMFIPLIRLVNNRLGDKYRQVLKTANRKYVAPLFDRIFVKSSDVQVDSRTRAELEPIFSRSNAVIEDLTKLNLAAYGYPTDNRPSSE